ncbi:hypothetical protein BJ742DRAFT_898277 [Cladochytrium replicatum]|nr:hypothetical protein BJ742DRAFT_898277 [Cladochytrium replicatum]
MHLSQVFLFEYGVIVLWNFTPYEERRYIDSLKKILQNGVGEGFLTVTVGNEEIEDFHFQYDLSGPSQPRIFEDLITLRSGNPLIKLTISSGLAQSVKLAIFEKIMEETIEDTRPLPKMMAEVGDVKLPRTDVMRTIGHLFKLRMDVNLVSNVLDTPELFWSVPELEGLYNAVRAYLEISQRVSILNNRMEVLSDLLEVLSDHMNSNQMNVITWIIIVLICFAVVIAVLEVWVKMLRLEAGLDF